MSVQDAAASILMVEDAAAAFRCARLLESGTGPSRPSPRSKTPLTQAATGSVVPPDYLRRSVAVRELALIPYGKYIPIRHRLRR